MKTLLRSTIAALFLMYGLNVNAGPTTGWTQSSFTYSIQTPWNLPRSDRYKLSSGVHYFWIYKGDACQYEGCSTGPRSEMRWNNNYTSGKHQFEGEVYVVSGTNGTDICQVFGGVTNSTALMLKVTSANGGTLKRYDNEVLATGIYGKWTKINMQHDADGNRVYVYINGVLKGNWADRGNATHYFKCGVYNITGTRSESRWRNLKYWKNGPVGKSAVAEEVPAADDNSVAVSTSIDGTTNINYTLAEAGYAKMSVYDAQGRLVNTIFQGYKPAGSYAEKWDGSIAAKGLYIVKFMVGSKSYTAKFVK